MSDGNKTQPYKYSLKCAGISRTAFCGNRIYCYITPPEGALTIENLKMHAVLQFYTGTPGIPAEYQKVIKIGVINAIVGTQEITYDRYLDVNIEADANRVVDIDINLTGLLKKDNVEFWGLYATDYPTTATFIYIEFPTDIVNYRETTPLTYKIGELFLWKIDALFTTLGIQ